MIILSVQPYKEILFQGVKNKLYSFEYDGNGIMMVNPYFVYLWSKSTGLRSNKKRHLKKRFNKTFWKSILENAERVLEAERIMEDEHNID